MTQPLRVMIVDDDETVLDITAALLEQHGYLVSKRASAIGTSLAMRREKPDVVLLDVNMPGLTGDRLAELMISRDGRASALVILHSSSSLAELERLAASCGAAEVIEKTSPGEFLRHFEAALARHGLGARRNAGPSRRF